jgi:TolA-binding protein
MAARAPAEATRDTRAGTFWQGLVDLFGGASLRPALGTALAVVLVVGIGIIFFVDRPRPEGLSPSESDELTAIPSSELSTQSAAEPEKVLSLAPAPPLQPPAPDPEPQQPPAPVVAQQPSRPPTAPTKSPAPPRVRRALEDSALARSAAARPRDAEAGSNAAAERPEAEASAPLVVEALRVPAEAPPPPSYAQPARSSGGGINIAPGQAVIPTPPLPQPTSAAQRQQFALDEQQQQPTPAGAATGQAAAPAPARVAVPAAQNEYERGIQSYRSGNYQDAADELNTFVRSPSSPARLIPSGIHHLAMSQRRLGNLSAAAQSYDQLLRRFPSYERRPQVLLEAAEVQDRLGNRTRAAALLSQLATVPGWSERARSEMARLQHRGIGTDGPLGPDDAYEAAEEVDSAAPAAEPVQAAPAGY